MRWILSALVLFPAVLQAEEPLSLKDGDRVVFVGSTLIEREQKYGYWETVLTIRHPDKNITFRNLGWSGDTVWGDSRCRFDFDKPGEGVRLIVEHVLALKPTVIVLGYGTNESFAGEAGLPRLREGLNALLDALAPSRARIALLAPYLREKVRAGSPSPDALNVNLVHYRNAIREVATSRNAEFLDLVELLKRPELGGPWDKLTDNTFHLSEYGYWRTSLPLYVGGPTEERPPTLEVSGPQRRAKLTLARLPPWPLARGHSDGSLVMAPVLPHILARNLTPGTYALSIDGQPAGSREAESWKRGETLLYGADYDQVERLRALIIEKNQLYFHRWRPQNETYLLGFRKHEQGQNAREIPEFDPMIAKLEKEITRLRVPVAHTYELVPVTK